MIRTLRTAGLMACVSLLFGCAIMTPPYQPALTNVETLKAGGDTAVKVGTFASSADFRNDSSISIRSGSLQSSVGGSYNAYLSDAIRQELTLAGRLSKDSHVEMTGALLKNNIDIGPFSKGIADIEARFIVSKDGVERYNQVKSAHLEWDSSFLGAIAIPRAQQNYPQVVQLLLGTLYADPDFLKALK